MKTGNSGFTPTPPPSTPRERIQRGGTRILITAGFLLLAFVVVLPAIAPRLLQKAVADGEETTCQPAVVSVTCPTPAPPGPAMSLPAEIRPWVEAPIYARASGYLKRRLVDIGSRVKEGQLLAEIDTPEINQELERARGQLAQAEASLGLAKITAARWAGLLKTASVSEQETAEKEADYKLKSAVTDSARAEVRRLERLQAFSRVTAPFAGTVTVRNVDFGDLIVAAGNKEIFHLAQTRKLRVFVQVPQAMARHISEGHKAEVTFPELPGHAHPASVIRTAGVISPDSRTLLVELEMDNPKDELLAGSYAQLRFVDMEPEPVITLPANTVLFRPEGPMVGVVGPEGVVELKKVKLGRDFGRTIQIEAGLDPKDRVILFPRDSLASGAVVTVAESETKEKGKNP